MKTLSTGGILAAISNAKRPTPNASLPFPGDLARQKQINRDVDALFKNLPPNTHRLTPTASTHPSHRPTPNAQSPLPDIFLSALFFISLIGCAVGGAAL